MNTEQAVEKLVGALRELTPPAQESPYMTRQEVESYYHVSRATVLRWQRSGRLISVRLPGVRATRYARAEVERLAEGSSR